MWRRLLISLTACLVLTTTAQAKDTLTVYTYESFIAEWGPGPAIKKNFESQCQCTVKWVGISDGVALLNRLKIEGENSKADIILGLDTTLVAEAKQTGLFTHHNRDLSEVHLPVKWQDPIFVPYDYAHFAVIYNREKMPKPPTSLHELVDGDKSQKIILQDPRTSTPGLGFLLWVKAVYGDQAPAAWAKLKQRVLTVTPGWSEAYGLFTKGEAPMVLSYVTSPAYHLIEEKTDRYAAASFSEGHYLQIEVAGQLKNAPHPKLAQRFLKFITEPGFQNFIATKNWMFPAGKIDGKLPKEFDTLVKPEITFIDDSEKVAKNRKAWIDEWLNAMSK